MAATVGEPAKRTTPHQTIMLDPDFALFPGEHRISQPLQPLSRAALSIARLGHGHQFNPFHNYVVGRYERFCSLRRLSCCSR